MVCLSMSWDNASPVVIWKLGCWQSLGRYFGSALTCLRPDYSLAVPGAGPTLPQHLLMEEHSDVVQYRSNFPSWVRRQLVILHEDKVWSPIHAQILADQLLESPYVSLSPHLWAKVSITLNS